MSGSFFFTLLYGYRSAAELSEATHDGLQYRIYTWITFRHFLQATSEENKHMQGGCRDLRVRSVCISICSAPILKPSPMLWNSAGDLLQISATGGDKQIKFSKTVKSKSLHIYSIEFKKCLLYYKILLKASFPL